MTQLMMKEGDRPHSAGRRGRFAPKLARHIACRTAGILIALLLVSGALAEDAAPITSIAFVPTGMMSIAGAELVDAKTEIALGKISPCPLRKRAMCPDSDDIRHSASICGFEGEMMRANDCWRKLGDVADKYQGFFTSFWGSARSLFVANAEAEDNYCFTPYEFRTKICTLTPKQRKLGMDVHNAIGVELLIKQMVIEMVMGGMVGLALADQEAPESSLTIEENARVITAFRRFAEDKLREEFLSFVDARTGAMLLHFSENQLRYLARFYQSNYGRRSVQYGMEARIQATDEILSGPNFSADDFYAPLELERKVHARAMEIVNKRLSSEAMSDDDNHEAMTLLGNLGLDVDGLLSKMRVLKLDMDDASEIWINKHFPDKLLLKLSLEAIEKREG